MGTDLRVAARSLMRRPGHSLIPVVTLAAVVAAATVIFSVLEGVLLRPLPYPQADRLYRVFRTSPADLSDRGPVTRDALRVWSDDAEGMEEVGGYVSMGGPWSDDLNAEGAFVFLDLFRVLGAEPLIGRLPTREEVRSSSNLVILSEALWTTRFGRDRDVIGRTVRYAWTSGTVVGVLPARFAFPSMETGWWSPVPGDFADGRTDVPQISAVVRLERGTGRETAEEELRSILAGRASDASTRAGPGVRLVPLRDEVVGDVRPGIVQLFWGVVLLVLIASANLAILVVARTSGRRGELAVRAALGAGRRALIGSILSEVLLLCAVGGGLGVLAATWLLDPVVDLLSGSFPGFPRFENVGMNVAVLTFAVGVAAAAAVLSGVMPALIWSGRPPWEALQGAVRSRGGRGTRLGQAGLLVLESGLAVVLLVAAGLLLRSVLHSHLLDPGFDDRRIAFLQVDFSRDRLSGGVELRDTGRRLEARLASLPVVTSAARARVLPTLGGTRQNVVWTPEREPEDGSWTTSVEVGPGYFRTMAIPLVDGREFEEGDDADAEPVAVVSRRVARQFFGDADPIGRIVLFGTASRMEGDRMVPGPGSPMRVVGVVEDVRQGSLLQEPVPVLYLPLAQRPTWRQTLVVRTAGDPGTVLDEIRRAVEEMAAPVTLVRWGALGRATRRPLAPLHVRTLLLLALGGLAGFLILVGIYGVVARVVADGVHEIGIRMALGARAREETVRVVRQILRPVLAGGVLGLGGAVLASRLVEQGLYGVGATDPLTYGTVLGLLVITGTVTAWVPARRAAAVDPSRALHRE